MIDNFKNKVKIIFIPPKYDLSYLYYKYTKKLLGG